MSDWPENQIKENSYLKGRIGWQGLRASEFIEDGPYLITGTNFISGKIDWGSCYHVSEARFKQAPNIHVKDRDLLITKDGTIGKIAYATNCPEKAVLNSGIFLLRCKDDSYNHKFAYHVLSSDLFVTFLRKNLNGSTINHLYQCVFEKFPIPLPHIKIQKKIVDILDCIDLSIEKTEVLIQKYQQIKQVLMHDLFTRGVTPDGKLRPTREQAPDLYKETSIGWIPEDWNLTSLKDLIGNSNIVNGPFGSDLLTSELFDEGIPVLYVQDVKPGYFLRVSKAHVKPQKALSLSFCNVKAEDILLAKVGSPPCDSCVYRFDEKAIVTQDVIRIRPPHNVDSNFVSAFLNSYIGRKLIRKISIEGTRERVSLSEFKNILIPEINYKEQFDIGRIIQTNQNLIDNEMLFKNKLLNKKAGLMKDLLTGKVQVKTD